ncbi:MAG: hypothetical protein AB7O52_17560 [Planctomycetota bacterium]
MPKRQYFLRYTREWGTPLELLSHVLSPFVGFCLTMLTVALCIVLLGIDPLFLLLPVTVVAAVIAFVFVSHSSVSFLQRSLREIDALRRERDDLALRIGQFLGALDGRAHLSQGERRELYEILRDHAVVEYAIADEVRLYNRRASRASRKALSQGAVPTELADEAGENSR